MLNEREIKVLVEKASEEIAKSLYQGKDCELRKITNGISITEVSKKMVSKETLAQSNH